MGPSVRERFGDLYELISTKVIPIPIGLDLHKMRDGLNGITALRLFRETQSADYGPRSKKILVDCCLNQTSKDRVALCKELRRSDHFEFMERRVLRGDLWKLYRRYDAILSLPGYGLDCHRTWEALYLGAKVIVQQVGLAGLYRGLPVAEFQDVEQLLSEELIYKLRQMDILRGQPAEFDQFLDIILGFGVSPQGQ